MKSVPDRSREDMACVGSDYTTQEEEEKKVSDISIPTLNQRCSFTGGGIMEWLTTNT
jgi:hypothetical protein